MDWLDSYKQDNLFDDSFVYSINELKKNFEVSDLDGGGWLILNWDKNKFLLQFVILQHYSSDLDGNVTGSCLFYGEGPSGSLRECRHTYWGETGYVFYPDGKLITSAFKELSKYFNEMV